ncbi:MAG: Proteasome lid subunit RPN8/RPN11 [Candidatus Alkanophagales archaeon MCA70_species_1]|nr:Proteasome lid subunit RPN8/RPN11 [Candidatus Alkanophaga volatiphilum]
MKIKRISKETLKLILNASRAQHPKEFLCLLAAERGVINDIILLPGTLSSRRSATLRLEMLPLGMGVIGSAHSHPTPQKLPSKEDLFMFSRLGRCHIIVCYPYGDTDWACYDRNGKPLHLEVL